MVTPVSATESEPLESQVCIIYTFILRVHIVGGNYVLCDCVACEESVGAKNPSIAVLGGIKVM